MKICYVSTDLITDEKQLKFLHNIPVRTKSALGNIAEVHFFNYISSGSIQYCPDNIINHSIHIRGFRASSSLLNSFLVVNEIRKYCIANDIDIVLNLSNHYKFYLIAIAARLCNTKKVARIAGIVPISSNFSFRRRFTKRIGQLFEILSLKLADHIICLSGSLKNELARRHTDPKKITVISQGVDLSIFSPAEGNKKPENKIHLLFVGRVVNAKGINELIQAYKILKESFTGLRLTICGHGNERDMFIRKTNNIAGITFIDFLTHKELVEQYHKSDVLVLPSYSEGLPNVVLEAMACGLPVVATRVGNIPVMLSENRGVLVKPRDVNDLVSGIKKISEDEEFRNNCIENSFAYVKSKHSLSVVSDLTIKFFQSIQDA